MRIEKVFEQDFYEYYKYSPTLFKPFYVNLEKLTFKRRIRLIFAFFVGYSVYYLAKNGEFIGYCLVQSGKDRRYKFATDKDIIVGPYFIKEEHRGKKLSIELLNYVLKESELYFDKAYDYIHKENIPSIKASKAVGFQYMSDANITRYTRRLKLCENNGQYKIFMYQRPNSK